MTTPAGPQPPEPNESPAPSESPGPNESPEPSEWSGPNVWHGPHEPARPAEAPLPTLGQGAPAESAKAKAAHLADGEWHHLHAATPLLRGGLAFLVVLGIVISNGRDWLVGLFIPDEYDYSDYSGNPVDIIVANNAVGWVLLAIIGFLILAVAGFWFAWRVAVFRVGDTEVEVKSGIVQRKHRRAPLNRIQAIQVTKPWFARLFGACKLEIETAGAEGKVELAYLSIAIADDLRREILHRASGRSERITNAQPGQAGIQFGSVPLGDPARFSTGNQRVDSTVREFIDPDAEIASLPPDQVVRVQPGRAIASSLLDGTIVWILVAIGVAIAVPILTGEFYTVFFMIPAFFGIGAWAVKELLVKLRFVVAATPDGIRLAYGVTTTTTENVPPGRIHSLTIVQPLLWRPFGWWQLRMTRAVGNGAETDSSGQAKQPNNRLLPVGTIDEVRRVVRAVVPDHELAHGDAFTQGLLGTGREPDGFVTSPSRARWFHPVSWRRNGIRALPAAFLLRTGRLRRSLQILPQARVQSVAMTQGFVAGWFSLASLRFHTVGQMTSNAITGLDARVTTELWERAGSTIIEAMVSDTSERWGAAPEVPDEGSRGFAFIGGSSAAREFVAEHGWDPASGIPLFPPHAESPQVESQHVDNPHTRSPHAERPHIESLPFETMPGETMPVEGEAAGQAPSAPDADERGRGEPRPGSDA